MDWKYVVAGWLTVVILAGCDRQEKDPTEPPVPPNAQLILDDLRVPLDRYEHRTSGSSH